MADACSLVFELFRHHITCTAIRFGDWDAIEEVCSTITITSPIKGAKIVRCTSYPRR